MIRRFLFPLMVLAASIVDVAAEESPSLPPKRDFHLFLLVGQSNMAGRGDLAPEDTTPHPRVLMLDKAGRWVPAVDPLHFDKPSASVGLGKTFGALIAEARPDVVVGLIPCAVGGSPIDAWTPGAYYAPTKSHPWDDALRRAKRALEAGTLHGILWHQGEADSADITLATAYEAKLHELIARFRKELQAPDVPFIVGQMGRFADAPWTEPREVVDRAHRELSAKVARTAFVNSDGLTHRGDKVHFDAKSYRELGRRFAEAHLTMTK